MTEQLVASFDIETSNLKADFGTLLAVCVKPWKQPTIIFREDKYERERRSQNPQMLLDVIACLNQYPILIAHNGVQFDRPFLNTLALVHGLKAEVDPKGKMIDPVLIARRHLAFSSNRLDVLSEWLGTRTRKTQVRREAWVQAIFDRDAAALDYIVDHCVKDVRVLEEVAWRLRKFIPQINHYGSY
ncbi:MAG TPA: ribonuclease H-like domain-containing protein [Candidatus Tripitaka californicus]|uniref:ribonuclease H-like domain-containing protein n=1 Tax=Candidatus Tripitaka californicus TaxID=3367616 RepID=UPI004026959C